MPSCVDLLVELDPQLLRRRFRPARDQLLNVDRLHQRLLSPAAWPSRRCRRCRCRASPAGTSPRPSCGTVFSTHSTIESDGFSIDELRLRLRAAALGRDVHINLVAGHDRHVHHGRRIVLGVLARAGRIGQDAGAQLVVLVQIGAAHAFVHHVLDAHGRVPLHVHADLQEDGHDAGVLADGAMAFGAHARVDQDLRDGVARRRRLLLLVGARQALMKSTGW